jgi:DNA-binding MarR family transcriptional regulator
MVITSQLTPTQLSSSLLRNSGAITNRIDRLEGAGFVKRLQDPNDRRGTLVCLRAKGLKTIEAAVDAYVVMEHAKVATLSSTDRKNPGQSAQEAARKHRAKDLDPA